MTPRRAGRCRDQRIHAAANLDPGTEMTVYGTRHSATGDLTLIVVNKAQARTGTISIAGFQAAGQVAAVQAQGDALDSPTVRYNGLADSDIPIDLTQVPPIIATIPGPSFQYSFPAYSVTALTVFAVPGFCADCLPDRGGWRAILGPR